MPSINMIATRRAERRNLESQIRMAGLIVLCLVVIAFGVLSFMTARIFATDRTIDQLNKQLSSIQPTVKQIADYEVQTRELQPRLQLLADSREKTLLWYSVMQDLSRSMPADTWLTDVSTVKTNQAFQPSQTSQGAPGSVKQRPAQKVSLKLRGTSVSQMMVGETMLRLNTWPEFESVDLSYTQQSAREDANTVEFEINAPLLDRSAKGGVTTNDSH